MNTLYLAHRVSQRYASYLAHPMNDMDDVLEVIEQTVGQQDLALLEDYCNAPRALQFQATGDVILQNPGTNRWIYEVNLKGMGHQTEYQFHDRDTLMKILRARF